MVNLIKIGILFPFLFISINSCKQDAEKQSINQLEIPLFEWKEINNQTIYVSHGSLNGRLPTLIELCPSAEGLNTTFTEGERITINGIEKTISESLTFNIPLTPFPKKKLKELNINTVQKKDISENAYFFVIPDNNFIVFLDNSNVGTEAGKKILRWLKQNLSKIDIYENMNISRLENNKISDSLLRELQQQSYKLDEKIHLKENW
nr:hypothetical protein [uncultured Fluviicola sp.]